MAILLNSFSTLPQPASWSRLHGFIDRFEAVGVRLVDAGVRAELIPCVDLFPRPGENLEQVLNERHASHPLAERRPCR